MSDTTAIRCTSGSSHWLHRSMESDMMSEHWGINTSVSWTTQPKSKTTWWRAPAWRRSITNICGCGSFEGKTITCTVNPLHPTIKVHILHTVLYISYSIQKENMLNDQRLFWLAVISFTCTIYLSTVWCHIDTERKKKILVTLTSYRAKLAILEVGHLKLE